MIKKTFQTIFGNKNITIEVGELAKQANGSVLVRYGDSVVLSTVCVSSKPKEVNFLPLTVTFEEKLYAVGKIPGGFLRREGKPSESGILASRMIDRTIRPLFPKGFCYEVQVINTVLSVDPEANIEMAAILGTSLALNISSLPFNRLLAGVNIGLIDDNLVVNPSYEDSLKSILDLVVSGTTEAINMVEASAQEVSEEIMLSALELAHNQIKTLIAFQEKIVAEVGKEKTEFIYYQTDEQIANAVRQQSAQELITAIQTVDKQERSDKISLLREQTIQYFTNLYQEEEDCENKLSQVEEVFDCILKQEVRRLIAEEKVRPDGRDLEEIRPLDCQIDLLPMVHGSALFTRGQTQVLSVCTLGLLNDYQIIDDLTKVDKKRFLHHYNFPPYSVGEVSKLGAVGRREIGHGALGEKALLQVLPDENEFPYTIRLVAEVLESNGSSSQASICAGSMALMAAGVPIKKPVAGIAMGLIKEGEAYTILTDIQGLEDHLGDMDFKVAGTECGITALQMDIKIDGLSSEIFRESLMKAKKARLFILETMKQTIAEARKQLSPLVPKVLNFTIDINKIKEVIGKGGKNINKIIEQCDNLKVEIEDNGSVFLYHQDDHILEKAKKMIQEIARTVNIGDIFEAKVVRLEKFGAFVNLYGEVDALLHISQIRETRVEKIEDELKEGEIVRVEVIAVDDKGKISVSMKSLMAKERE